MEEKLLKYKTIEPLLQFSKTENCRISITNLKNSIRQHLALDQTHCILISCLKNGASTETVIMIECLKKDTMNIFKISKCVTDITEKEIPQILLNPCINKLAPIGLVNRYTHLF